MTDPEDRREGHIVRAFLNLSQQLVDDYDVVDMLLNLTTSCAEVLDVASVGLLVADDRGNLHLIASSSERMQHLELLQLQRDEGPCLDCYHAGQAVVVDDLAAPQAAARWPQFVSAALEAGYRSVHAVPMRLRGEILGTMGLFGNQSGGLSPEDVALAQALAHVATVSIVNQKSADDRDLINTQLQHALTSRVSIEQAKGLVAYAAGLDMDDAFATLRHYARTNNLKLTDVASRVVDRTLQTETLLAQNAPKG